MRQIHGVQGSRPTREADWAEGVVRDMPHAVRLTVTQENSGTAMDLTPDAARKIAAMLVDSADRVDAGLAQDR